MIETQWLQRLFNNQRSRVPLLGYDGWVVQQLAHVIEYCCQDVAVYVLLPVQHHYAAEMCQQTIIVYVDVLQSRYPRQQMCRFFYGNGVVVLEGRNDLNAHVEILFDVLICTCLVEIIPHALNPLRCVVFPIAQKPAQLVGVHSIIVYTIYLILYL